MKIYHPGEKNPAVSKRLNVTVKVINTQVNYVIKNDFVANSFITILSTFNCLNKMQRSISMVDISISCGLT